MKIINDTTETLNYLVTPSGLTLSGSKIIASGWIYPFSAGEVSVPAGNGPIVYVRGNSSQTSTGPTYIGRKLANADSVVRIRITEEC